MIKPTVSFDHHGSDYAANWLTIDRELREKTPVAWSEAHGGFWILSTYRDCFRAAQDWRTFSSENDVTGAGNGGGGIMIPSNTFQFALSESDPPQSTEIRKIETPFFVPNRIAHLREVIRANAGESLDRVIANGEIELVRDLAIPAPAKTVLTFAGIPLTDWETFAYPAHDMSHMPPTHPDYPHAQIAHVQQLILDLVRLKRREPAGDLISALMQGEVHGQPMSDEMAVGVVSAIVFGGFDTTTTCILNALLYLDEHPELRPVLRDDPAKMDAAIDEWLRLFPPGHSLGRTVVKPVEVGGYTFQPGERVMLLWSAANRDPAKFERPDEFWLERPNAGQHLTFSSGVHRCLGSLVGKLEIQGTLETVLSRIGDYRIDRDRVTRYRTIGLINGFEAMPATFTPQRTRATESLALSH